MRTIVFRVLLGAIGASGLAGGLQAEPARTFAAVQAGAMTDDVWETVLFAPPNIDFRDSYAAGASVGREWPLWDIGYVGIEASLLRHWGEQDHWELSAPVYLRSWMPAHPALPNLAYGLGLSYAGDPPEVEIDRKGASQELLAYWFIELEFGRPESKTRPFLRLHHRSDAFGAFETDTGSNLILFGLRQSF